MNTVIDTHNYKIFCGDDIFPELRKFVEAKSFSKIFLLLDENTKKFCFPLLEPYLNFPDPINLIEINSGEENKNIQTCCTVWEKLSLLQADRKSLLINLGGGVTGDMGGFIASTFKRGISFINIPTTLLSQVDASVGGKLGIDFNNLKNEIGLFAEPKAVYINPGFLKTLNSEQLLSGFAEMVKHALITDYTYWQELKEAGIQSENDWQKLIEKSVQIKNNIVIHDPFEKNLRKVLNFGHTIGHAIESFSLLNDRQPLQHGQAVAIGIVCEAYLSNRLNGLPELELAEISAFIMSTYPKYNIPKEKLKEIVGFMYHDKKNENNNINFTLLNRIAAADINKSCQEPEIYKALEYYRGL